MWVFRRLHPIWLPQNSMRMVERWSRIHSLQWSICVQRFPKWLRIEGFTLVVDTPVCRTVDTLSHHDGPRPREKHAVSIVYPRWLIIFYVGDPSENGLSNCILMYSALSLILQTIANGSIQLRRRTVPPWILFSSFDNFQTCFRTTISIWLMIPALVFLFTPLSILIFAMYRNCLSALLQWNVSTFSIFMFCHLFLKKLHSCWLTEIKILTSKVIWNDLSMHD